MKKNKTTKGNNKTVAEDIEKEEKEIPSEEEKTTEDVVAEPDQVALLEAKVAELEGVIESMKDENLRRAADTENYKKRLRQDKENAIKFANEQLIGDLLTPLENFSRAIEAANTTSDFEAMKQGVVMVQDQMMSILKTNWGLEPIKALGKEFDPNRMEAYSVKEEEGLEKETVLQEFTPGWTLNGKVLKTAKVLVGKPKKD